VRSLGGIYATRCGEPPPKRGLSHCIRDGGHEAGHVFWNQHRDTLNFYDTFARPLVHCDLKDGAAIEDDEAAALWAYLEAIKESRAKKSESQGSDRSGTGAGDH